MTDPELEGLTSEEARVREVLRALPRPAADADFRARLKREFVSGTITSALGDAATREHSRDSAAGPGRRILRGPWLPPLAWAAAAVFLVVGIAGLNRGPQWHLSGVSGSGIAVVDGHPVPLEHAAVLGDLLRPGAKIQVPPGAELELTAAGQLAIRVMGGTDMTLPRTPGRWFARDGVADLKDGELRITTGPRFHGSRLAVNTPEARVAVTGTTLAVIREPQGTCVCVFEGTVDVGAKAGDMVRVGAGRRRFVFNDGRQPEDDHIRDIERTKLGEFREEKGVGPGGR